MRGILDIETLGLDPFSGQVIAIGIKVFENYTDRIHITNDERELLEWFWSQTKGFDVLIGWNIKKFDLWFLLIRSLKYKIKINKNFQVIDLMECLFPNGQRWKRLSDVSETFFGERKDRSGQMIMEAFLKNDTKTIEKYLKEDLVLTTSLYSLMEECNIEFPRNRVVYGVR